MYTVDQLRAIAASGGGFELDAYAYTVDQLRAIASSASSGGARITLDLAKKKLTVDKNFLSRLLLCWVTVGGLAFGR